MRFSSRCYRHFEFCLISTGVSILLGEACNRLGRLREVLPTCLFLAHGFSVRFKGFVGEFSEVHFVFLYQRAVGQSSIVWIVNCPETPEVGRVVVVVIGGLTFCSTRHWITLVLQKTSCRMLMLSCRDR